MATQSSRLPWQAGSFPLMLAPMQGLTNRALRELFIEKYQPDVVFTEFVRVQSGQDNIISNSDRLEVAAQAAVPLVVQLLGSDPGSLVQAATLAQQLGCCHLNINLGCPYGRMAGNKAGGALLADPSALQHLLASLRQAIDGSFSVKVRAGLNDPGQILKLLPIFSHCEIDFLILHPRTVQQGFKGRADHRLTAEVVKNTPLPVIANGDIFDHAYGRRVLHETGAAGLMLGRGAIGDPLLFRRLQGGYPAHSCPETRATELHDYLQQLLPRYLGLFQGEQQVLHKLKEVVNHIHDPALEKTLRKLQKAKKLAAFQARLDELPHLADCRPS